MCGCGGMVDALASGANGGNIVWVRVPSSAPKKKRNFDTNLRFFFYSGTNEKVIYFL